MVTPTYFTYAAGCTTQAEKDACAKAGGTCKFASAAYGGNWYCSIPSEEAGKSDTVVGWAVSKSIDVVLRLISQVLITISAGILTLSGTLFDGIVDYTITKMADQVNNVDGIGGSINVAWATIRDVANMFFIFILLYAAFKALFSLNIGGSGTIIRNIIIAALLINFSLFLTKVVIDASNVVSHGFYKAIVSANVQSTNTQSTPRTIASGYMRLIGLQSWYDPGILTHAESLSGFRIIVVGVMSSVFFLITAVVFLMTAVMFVARFIILIFVMILSPLAVVAAIIPSGQVKQKFNEWKDALINQAVFAPVFFAMTWVAITVASKVLPTLGPKLDSTFIDLATKPPAESAALILNYVLVIGFAVAALIVSKQIATKTAGFGAISGGIGTGIIGGAGLIGRQTIGRVSKSAMDNEWLREKSSKSGIAGAAARAGLWAANKGAKGSYDIRGIAESKVGKLAKAGELMSIAGKASGKGGFTEAVKQKAEREAKYAKEVLGQTDAEKELAAKLKPKYDASKNVEDSRIKAEKDRIRTEIESKENEMKNVQSLKKQKEIQEQIDKLKKELEKPDSERYSKEFRELHEEFIKADRGHVERQKRYAEVVRGRSPVSTSTGGLGGAATGAAIGSALGPIGTVIGASIGAGIGAGLGGWLGGKMTKLNWAGNKAAARKIAAEAGGKSKKERLADLAMELQKEEWGETPAPPLTTPPAGGDKTSPKSA